MTNEVKVALQDLISGSKIHCVTTWQDDEGTRSLSAPDKQKFSILAGREVSLEDFVVFTGGFEDGKGYPKTKLVEDIMRNIV